MSKYMHVAYAYGCGWVIDKIYSMLNECSSVKVEEEVIKQQEVKRGTSSKSKAQDKAITIIRLR